MESLDKLANALLHDKVLSKYIDNHTWISGCSTTVYPVQINEKRQRIEIQLKDGATYYRLRRVFKMIKEEYGAKTAYISKGDGSCPNVLVIYMNGI